MAGGILGGIVILFVLPVLLTATTTADPSTGAPLPDPTIDVPPELSAYEPEVRQLIETTYLGRSKEFPDPEEPAVVLEKYLEQNAHGYQQLLIEDIETSRISVPLSAITEVFDSR